MGWMQRRAYPRTLLMKYGLGEVSIGIFPTAPAQKLPAAMGEVPRTTMTNPILAKYAAARSRSSDTIGSILPSISPSILPAISPSILPAIEEQYEAEELYDEESEEE